MKKIHCIKLIYLDVLIAIILSIIIGILWIVVGTTEIINAINGFLISIVLFCIPICIWNNIYHLFVAIDEQSIECEVLDGKSGNGGWVEDLVNIQSVKITTKEECRKIYKDCRSKKVILIDFGQGNIKYIALKWFTRKQSQRILETINENLEKLKAPKQSN